MQTFPKHIFENSYTLVDIEKGFTKIYWSTKEINLLKYYQLNRYHLAITLLNYESPFFMFCNLGTIACIL